MCALYRLAADADLSASAAEAAIELTPEDIAEFQSIPQCTSASPPNPHMPSNMASIQIVSRDAPPPAVSPPTVGSGIPFCSLATTSPKRSEHRGLAQRPLSASVASVTSDSTRLRQRPFSAGVAGCGGLALERAQAARRRQCTDPPLAEPPAKISINPVELQPHLDRILLDLQASRHAPEISISGPSLHRVTDNQDNGAHDHQDHGAQAVEGVGLGLCQALTRHGVTRGAHTRPFPGGFGRRPPSTLGEGGNTSLQEMWQAYTNQ